jgi:hypothetical protein
MPPENNYYNEVILNDPTLTLDNPVAGHEIQMIVGSPSKVAKGTLIDFAKKLMEHTRVNQGWSGVHVIVEPREFRDACRGRPSRLDSLNRAFTSSHHPRPIPLFRVSSREGFGSKMDRTVPKDLPTGSHRLHDHLTTPANVELNPTGTRAFHRPLPYRTEPACAHSTASACRPCIARTHSFASGF